MPTEALNLEFGVLQACQYDSLDSTRRYVYSEEVHDFKLIDASLGFVITDFIY